VRDARRDEAGATIYDNALLRKWVLGASLATASLLVGDVTEPLIPDRGRLPVGRLEPDQELIDRTPVDGDLVSRWGMRLEGMAEHLKVGGR